jgi:hypothetical protein
MALLKYSLSVPNRKHILSRLYLPPQQFGCLGDLTVNSIRCRGSMRYACRHCVAMDLYFSVPCIRKETRCVGSAEIRTRPLSSSVHIRYTAHFGRSLRSSGRPRIRLLGVASQYIYTTCFNIHKLSILPTECVFPMILTNSCYFPKQH